MVINASGGSKKLVSSGALRRQPGAVYVSFPYDVFERAVLTLFRELKASDVLVKNGKGAKAEALAGKLAGLNHKIAVTRKKADESPDVEVFLDMLADYERAKKTVAAELDAARAEAAGRGGAEALGELQSLAELLDEAEDKEPLRLKIRSRVRQLVSEAWVLVVSLGAVRLAAVQLFFAEGGGRRDYVISYRPYPKRSKAAADGLRWQCLSAAEAGAPGDLDLRKPEDAAELMTALSAINSRE
jgi:hypothetical protein